MMDCGCSQCRAEKNEPPRIVMVVCSECGNKRCPHATDHRLICTHSNEPGQAGSSYGYPMPSQINMYQANLTPAHGLFAILMEIQKKFPEHQHKSTTLAQEAYLKILDELIAKTD